MTTALKAGSIYFICVFGAGFVLGVIRVTALVPRLGERFSELLEMPLMLAVIIVMGRFVVRRFRLSGARSQALVCGFFAAILLLVTEFTVVLSIRGLTLAQFFAERDPVAAAAYYLMVAVFALVPFLFSIRSE